jgi:hypothetical protein
VTRRPSRRRFALAAGRPLPRLLFVTSGGALGRRIGARMVRTILDGVIEAGHAVHDTLPASVQSPARALASARRALARDSTIEGVVILGSYDVVPAQRIDCLPARLRAHVRAADDPDNFMVWSDDGYGDRDGDSLPELPVSRVPDGGSAQLLYTALQTPAIRAVQTRRGVRNVARPFADRVFGRLPGRAAMLRSSPARHNTMRAHALDADCVYLVLHGLPARGTAFWGEDGHRHPMAVTAANVPDRPGLVVFSGCCYGALTVDQPASVPSAARAKSRGPDGSVALSFLESGARAFVGSTALHYSPVQPPYDYFGAPLHEAFWRAFIAGEPPARALWQAKHHYAAAVPHGQARNSVAEAIEFKTFREFTCLGLGW